ncbi:UDP-N-acetylmuramate--L-alanine ligase [Quillaja saponaria]|uniref:UDP-N-acetylmuramate--L-alanine ligase n=1 Tax=Quillaja saponaria TaxID=32244 RepID=A0AAD7L4U5_QUISA|nr:UDP-N-acetylmuramate--L-alanine ligase [Quillaja saponaria]
MENSRSFMSCEKLDRMANWFGTNVVSAFFTSLERCACINLSTIDNEEDKEAHDRPLMLAKPISLNGSEMGSKHITDSDKLPA